MKNEKIISNLKQKYQEFDPSTILAFEVCSNQNITPEFIVLIVKNFWNKEGESYNYSGAISTIIGLAKNSSIHLSIDTAKEAIKEIIKLNPNCLEIKDNKTDMLYPVITALYMKWNESRLFENKSSIKALLDYHIRESSNRNELIDKIAKTSEIIESIKNPKEENFKQYIDNYKAKISVLQKTSPSYYKHLSNIINNKDIYDKELSYGIREDLNTKIKKYYCIDYRKQAFYDLLVSEMNLLSYFIQEDDSLSCKNISLVENDNILSKKKLYKKSLEIIKGLESRIQYKISNDQDHSEEDQILSNHKFQNKFLKALCKSKSYEAAFEATIKEVFETLIKKALEIDSLKISSNDSSKSIKEKSITSPEKTEIPENEELNIELPTDQLGTNEEISVINDNPNKENLSDIIDKHNIYVKLIDALSKQERDINEITRLFNELPESVRNNIFDKFNIYNKDSNKIFENNIAGIIHEIYQIEKKTPKKEKTIDDLCKEEIDGLHKINDKYYFVVSSKITLNKDVEEKLKNSSYNKFIKSGSDGEYGIKCYDNGIYRLKLSSERTVPISTHHINFKDKKVIIFDKMVNHDAAPNYSDQVYEESCFDIDSLIKLVGIINEDYNFEV
jgi:hypothetical protein